MEERLAVLCVDFEAEKEVFVGGEGDASPASLDEDREEGGEEAREDEEADEGGPGQLPLEHQVDTDQEVGGEVEAAEENPGTEVGGAGRLHPDTL